MLIQETTSSSKRKLLLLNSCQENLTFTAVVKNLISVNSRQVYDTSEENDGPVVLKYEW